MSGYIVYTGGMPVRTITDMEQREQIARMALSGCYTVTDIAQLMGVSRPTVYRYRDRYAAEGRVGLADRSRAPHGTRRMAEEIEEQVIRERKRYGWGSKKIRQRLIDRDPCGLWPARSTIDEILRRHGLTRPRRRRRTYHSPFLQPFEPHAPGELHTIDFKGEFRLRDRRWCHPLTMTDGFSRYLLACEALRSIHLDLVWPVVVRVFREHGLPLAVLSDNGPPFGAHGMGRISGFSVRLMELGIRPVFIRPGHPEQNGSHERMHRSLKESSAIHPTDSFRQQQQLFDTFRSIYNHERPHEGIGLERPARRHTPSPRPFPATLPNIEYPSTFEVRSIHRGGEMKWGGAWLYVSKALVGRIVGLELIDEHLWNVYFGSFLIGRLHERERRFV